MHSLFANAPAVATGVAAALRAKGRTDVRVVGQGGDGGTVDIGFACLSGMFERGDDVLYICYDNQGYMNTGVQRSGATPPAARTATTEPLGGHPGNAFGQGKSAPLIAMAHEIPYVATATVAELRDLEAKVTRAMELPRRRATCTCSCPARSAGARRRRETIADRAAGQGERPVPGLRGRRRAHHVGVAHPPPGRRSRSTCAARSASRTCSSGDGRPDVVARLQALADRNIERFGLLDGPTRRSARSSCSTRSPRPSEGRHERRAAVRDHARRRLEPGQPHRRLAHRAARCTSAACRPATTPARPARTSRRGSYDAEDGRRGLRARVAHARRRQPAPRRDGARLLPPLRDGLQPRPARRGGRHQLGRALPRRRGDPRRLGAARPPTRATGKRVLVVGAGPSGLSVAYQLALARPSRHDPRAGAAGPAG